jgi:dipeptidyl aminopeptidase/acylaminoacyl peptidase
MAHTQGHPSIQGYADPTVPYSHSLRLREVLNKAAVENEPTTILGGKHGMFTAEERIRIYAGVRQFLESTVCQLK